MTMQTLKSPFNLNVSFGSRYSACFDIQSAEDIILVPNKPVAVSTGLYFRDDLDSTFRQCYCVQVMSRSGLSLKGVQVFNAPGIIDGDYEDEIKVVLNYVGEGEYKVSKGDRIAQGTIVEIPYEQLNLRSISNVNSGRVGGFGSTGI